MWACEADTALHPRVGWRAHVLACSAAHFGLPSLRLTRARLTARAGNGYYLVFRTWNRSS